MVNDVLNQIKLKINSSKLQVETQKIYARKKKSCDLESKNIAFLS